MRAMNMYVKNGLLLLSFLCGPVFYALPQINGNANRHSLIIKAGLQTLSDDGLFVSYEKLSTAGFQYVFTSSNGRCKKSIVTGFDKGTGNTSKGQLRSDEFLIRYTHAFSVKKNNTGPWNYYIGYGISVNPQYLRRADQYSWATSGSLFLYNSLSFSWRKSTVDVDLSISLAGLASRPDSGSVYKGTNTGMLYNSFSDLAFTSWHNLKDAKLSLFYKTAIGRDLGFTGGAFYRYKAFSQGNEFATTGLGFGAGIYYQFR